MRILFDIGHPTNVHFFKNIIWNLERDGHEVKITLRNKDVTKYLLDIYRFKYDILIEQHYKGLLKKAMGMLKIDYKLYKIAKEFRPNVLIGESPYVAHVGKLLNRPSIVFCNNESEYGARFDNMTFSPFADAICTPTSFEGKFHPKKHVKYNGYYFLAYLHPMYFQPDLTVLDALDLEKGEKFFILRFRTYDAAHDIGQGSFDRDRLKIIKGLEKDGKVFVKSDIELSGEIKKYELPPIEKMHDLLYFADLYIGDGISMAAETAIMGTPSILVSTLAWGYIKELRDRYNLLYTCQNATEALKIVSSLQKEPDLKKKWKEKKEKMLSEKIDVTEWVTNFIERYPESFYEYQSKQGNMKW